MRATSSSPTAAASSWATAWRISAPSGPNSMYDSNTWRSAKCLNSLSLAVLVSTCACPFWPDHDQGELPPPDVFIATNADFADYKTWPSIVVGEAAIENGHPAGQRRVFASHLPADDADHFDVGTIFVKEGAGLEVEGGTGVEVHAMVKRGGGFNASGAIGWEWFELGESTIGTPIIKWRGQEPPDGESYGCLIGDCSSPLGQCNSCHGAAVNNDFILSPGLTLGDFGPFGAE